MKRALLVLGVVGSVASSLAAPSASSAAPASVDAALPCDTQSYTARGVVKVIADDRRTVTIAHETIPGYMNAMTMSFELTAASQLDGVKVGDRVQIGRASCRERV